MNLTELKKDELLAKCEELIAQNEELTAKNAELAAAPNGNAKDLKDALAAKEQECEDLKGVVTSLNEKLVLQAKTRGSNNPTGTIEVDGTKLNLEVVHGLRKGQKNYTKQEIADDAKWLAELYAKKSTAVRVVA